MKNRDVLAIFNRGRISKLALARTDVSRVALSAAIQTNWMPRTLGAMSLRPGWKYNGSHIGDGANIPFIFTNDDTAMIELSAGAMRIWDDGDTFVARASVASAVTNGLLSTDLSSWTDADETGAASTWVSGAMQLVGTGALAAKRRQQVTVSGGDVGTEHALRINIGRGPLLLRIGTTAGADDVFRQAVLRTGVHSIAFTPTGSFWIEFSSTLTYPVLVDDCTVESSGVLSLPTPWVSVEACKAVRWQQSGDVIFTASGYQQRRIERRPNNSWSVAVYEVNDGPYLTENTSNTTLTPSNYSGAITLTASQSIFRDEHVGALFKLTSQGQTVGTNISSELTYTDTIRVTGVTTTRIFQVRLAGTWSGTLTLQRSIGVLGVWEDYSTYTTNVTTSVDDGLDNSVVYYRIGFNAGNYTSGTAAASLAYSVGSITGAARVTGFTSETVVSAVVVDALGAITATETWAEGAWSDVQGWPTAVAISAEGRLWWSGNGRNYGSVSDAFAVFDPDYEGDAAPINRRVGAGAVNKANWVLPLQNIVVGTDSAEHSVRSNSFDEPITPTNYNTKSSSTKGSKSAPAAMVDGRGYFIGRTGRKLYEMQYDGSTYDYASLDATLLVPEIGDAGFERVAVQQNPDMRVHVVKADGTVAVLVRDPAEDVLCWVDVETDGEVEDVIVLPGPDSDRVFYRVKRNISGADVWYNEEWASERDCVGGTLNLQADSYVTGTGSVTGLNHLEGKTVVVWADGVDQGTAVVNGGTVSGSYTSWVAGLYYEARYKSAKLSTVIRDVGSTLSMRSRINDIGLILADTHAQGLQYGPSFDVMDDLPLIENGAVVGADSVWSEYDEDVIEFPGEWDTDNRLHLKAAAPRPCTVCAAILINDRQSAA